MTFCIIHTKTRLQAFYPPQALEQLVQKIASTDLAGFGARWRLPKEVRCPYFKLQGGRQF